MNVATDTNSFVASYLTDFVTVWAAGDGNFIIHCTHVRLEMTPFFSPAWKYIQYEGLSVIGITVCKIIIQQEYSSAF